MMQASNVQDGFLEGQARKRPYILYDVDFVKKTSLLRIIVKILESNLYRYHETIQSVESHTLYNKDVHIIELSTILITDECLGKSQ